MEFYFLSKNSSWLFLFLLTFACFRQVEAQWVNDPGTGWIDLSVIHHRTDTQFWFDGSNITMFEEGRVETTASYLSTAVGVVRGVDLWLQIPFLRSRFSDIVGDRLSSGIGDPRIHLRANSNLFGIESFPLAIRVGLKVPIGSFEKDAEIIPLGDGQLDLESILEMGYSFRQFPLYVKAWLGYRWRAENETSAFKPGNEQIVFLSAGYSSGPFTFDLSLDYLNGSDPISQGLKVPTARRTFTQITPRVGYKLGELNASLGLRFAVAGRNLPSGTAVMFSLFRPLLFK